MKDIRIAIRTILEAMEIGPDGKATSNDASGIDQITLELVDEYIMQHRDKDLTFSTVGRFRTYLLPMDAKAYFDHIGFKGYELVRLKDKTTGRFNRPYVQVKDWVCSDMAGDEI